MYLITEPYDGSAVRILACARTPGAAEQQYDREVSARSLKGYGFFSPVRRVIGSRKEVESLRLDRRVAQLPTW